MSVLKSLAVVSTVAAVSFISPSVAQAASTSPAAAAAAASNATASPEILLGGPLLPGYTVKLSLSGINYAKGPVVVKGFGDQTTFVDENSNIRNLIRIASSTPVGTHRVTAEQAGVIVAEYYAYVGEFNPTAYPSAYFAPAKTRLTFAGEGWKAGESVKLYRNGVYTGKRVTAGSGAPYFYDLRGKLPTDSSPYAAGSALSYYLAPELAGSTQVFELRGQGSGKTVRLTVSVA